MGETLPSWKPACNLSVSVQLSERKTSSDAGAFLLREVLDRSGVIESLDRQLLDDRDPARVQHSLSSQLRTLLVQRALGWDDLSDTQTLANDPVLQLACSDQRSTRPLEQPRPSQPTLSRLLNLLATDINQSAFHDGLLDMAMWRLSSMRSGKPLSSITLDVDGLPIETFGQQVRTGYNSYVGYSHYSPLVASIAETGDMVGGLLREGNSSCAVQAEHWIPKLVERIGKTTVTKVRVRFDAGFTGNPTLSALDDANIEYVGRLSSNTALEREAAHYLKRPVGRPTHQLREWCHEFYYQAQSWEKPRRIILVVCEQQVMGRNQVSLLLSLYAYQMLHSLRALMERVTQKGWSIRKVHEQILKTAATVAVHARKIAIHIGQSGGKWWPSLLKNLPRLHQAQT